MWGKMQETHVFYSDTFNRFQLSEPAICVCMKDEKIKALRLDRRNIFWKRILEN